MRHGKKQQDYRKLVHHAVVILVSLKNEYFLLPKLQIMSKVLITGASGLIGSRLTDVLLEQMHEVVHLGRSARQGRVKSFIWDVEKQTMDASSLEGVDAIVHLAGAGVADKRWTSARKKEILDSRIQSTELLFKTLQETKHSVKTLVAASAIGYYGFGLGDELFTEDSPPGLDFLAQVTQQWEAQVSKISVGDTGGED